VIQPDLLVVGGDHEHAPRSARRQEALTWPAHAEVFFMPTRPWQSAGVSKAGWERAQKAVIGRAANLVWRARKQEPADTRTNGLDDSMERLAGIGRGDPDATRYGLNLADAEPQDGES
jgi:hypothetical protein